MKTKANIKQRRTTTLLLTCVIALVVSLIAIISCLVSWKFNTKAATNSYGEYINETGATQGGEHIAYNKAENAIYKTDARIRKETLLLEPKGTNDEPNSITVDNLYLLNPDGTYMSVNGNHMHFQVAYVYTPVDASGTKYTNAFGYNFTNLGTTTYENKKYMELTFDTNKTLQAKTYKYGTTANTELFTLEFIPNLVENGDGTTSGSRVKFSLKITFKKLPPTGEGYFDIRYFGHQGVAVATDGNSMVCDFEPANANEEHAVFDEVFFGDRTYKPIQQVVRLAVETEQSIVLKDTKNIENNNAIKQGQYGINDVRSYLQLDNYNVGAFTNSSVGSTPYEITPEQAVEYNPSYDVNGKMVIQEWNPTYSIVKNSLSARIAERNQTSSGVSYSFKDIPSGTIDTFFNVEYVPYLSDLVLDHFGTTAGQFQIPNTLTSSTEAVSVGKGRYSTRVGSTTTTNDDTYIYFNSAYKLKLTPKTISTGSVSWSDLKGYMLYLNFEVERVGAYDSLTKVKQQACVSVKLEDLVSQNIDDIYDGGTTDDTDFTDTTTTPNYHYNKFTVGYDRTETHADSSVWKVKSSNAYSPADLLNLSGLNAMTTDAGDIANINNRFYFKNYLATANPLAICRVGLSTECDASIGYKHGQHEHENKVKWTSPGTTPIAAKIQNENKQLVVSKNKEVSYHGNVFAIVSLVDKRSDDVVQLCVRFSVKDLGFVDKDVAAADSNISGKTIKVDYNDAGGTAQTELHYGQVAGIQTNGTQKVITISNYMAEYLYSYMPDGTTTNYKKFDKTAADSKLGNYALVISAEDMFDYEVSGDTRKLVFTKSGFSGSAYGTINEENHYYWCITEKGELAFWPKKTTEFLAGQSISIEGILPAIATPNNGAEVQMSTMAPANLTIATSKNLTFTFKIQNSSINTNRTVDISKITSYNGGMTTTVPNKIQLIANSTDGYNRYLSGRANNNAINYKSEFELSVYDLFSDIDCYTDVNENQAYMDDYDVLVFNDIADITNPFVFPSEYVSISHSGTGVAGANSAIKITAKKATRGSQSITIVARDKNGTGEVEKVTIPLEIIDAKPIYKFDETTLFREGSVEYTDETANLYGNIWKFNTLLLRGDGDNLLGGKFASASEEDGYLNTNKDFYKCFLDAKKSYTMPLSALLKDPDGNDAYMSFATKQNSGKSIISFKLAYNKKDGTPTTKTLDANKVVGSNDMYRKNVTSNDLFDDTNNTQLFTIEFSNTTARPSITVTATNKATAPAMFSLSFVINDSMFLSDDVFTADMRTYSEYGFDFSILSSKPVVRPNLNGTYVAREINDSSYFGFGDNYRRGSNDETASKQVDYILSDDICDERALAVGDAGNDRNIYMASSKLIDAKGKGRMQFSSDGGNSYENIEFSYDNASKVHTGFISYANDNSVDTQYARVEYHENGSTSYLKLIYLAATPSRTPILKFYVSNEEPGAFDTDSGNGHYGTEGSVKLEQVAQAVVYKFTINDPGLQFNTSAKIEINPNEAKTEAWFNRFARIKLNNHVIDDNSSTMNVRFAAFAGEASGVLNDPDSATQSTLANQNKFSTARGTTDELKKYMDISNGNRIVLVQGSLVDVKKKVIENQASAQPADAFLVYLTDNGNYVATGPEIWFKPVGSTTTGGDLYFTANLKTLKSNTISTSSYVVTFPISIKNFSYGFNGTASANNSTFSYENVNSFNANHDGLVIKPILENKTSSDETSGSFVYAYDSVSSTTPITDLANKKAAMLRPRIRGELSYSQTTIGESDGNLYTADAKELYFDNYKQYYIRVTTSTASSGTPGVDKIGDYLIDTNYPSKTVGSSTYFTELKIKPTKQSATTQKIDFEIVDSYDYGGSQANTLTFSINFNIANAPATAADGTSAYKMNMLNQAPYVYEKNTTCTELDASTSHTCAFFDGTNHWDKKNYAKDKFDGGYTTEPYLSSLFKDSDIPMKIAPNEKEFDFSSYTTSLTTADPYLYVQLTYGANYEFTTHLKILLKGADLSANSLKMDKLGNASWSPKSSNETIPLEVLFDNQKISVKLNSDLDESVGLGSSKIGKAKLAIYFSDGIDNVFTADQLLIAENLNKLAKWEVGEISTKNTCEPIVRDRNVPYVVNVPITDTSFAGTITTEDLQKKLIHMPAYGDVHSGKRYAIDSFALMKPSLGNHVSDYLEISGTNSVAFKIKKFHKLSAGLQNNGEYIYEIAFKYIDSFIVVGDVITPVYKTAVNKAIVKFVINNGTGGEASNAPTAENNANIQTSDLFTTSNTTFNLKVGTNHNFYASARAYYPDVSLNGQNVHKGVVAGFPNTGNNNTCLAKDVDNVGDANSAGVQDILYFVEKPQVQYMKKDGATTNYVVDTSVDTTNYLSVAETNITWIPGYEKPLWAITIKAEKELPAIEDAVLRVTFNIRDIFGNTLTLYTIVKTEGNPIDFNNAGVAGNDNLLDMTTIGSEVKSVEFKSISVDSALGQKAKEKDTVENVAIASKVKNYSVVNISDLVKDEGGAEFLYDIFINTAKQSATAVWKQFVNKAEVVVGTTISSFSTEYGTLEKSGGQLRFYPYSTVAREDNIFEIKILEYAIVDTTGGAVKKVYKDKTDGGDQNASYDTVRTSLGKVQIKMNVSIPDSKTKIKEDIPNQVISDINKTNTISILDYLDDNDTRYDANGDMIGRPVEIYSAINPNAPIIIDGDAAAKSAVEAKVKAGETHSIDIKLKNKLPYDEYGIAPVFFCEITLQDEAGTVRLGCVYKNNAPKLLANSQLYTLTVTEGGVAEYRYTKPSPYGFERAEKLSSFFRDIDDDNNWAGESFTVVYDNTTVVNQVKIRDFAEFKTKIEDSNVGNEVVKLISIRDSSNQYPRAVPTGGSGEVEIKVIKLIYTVTNTPPTKVQLQDNVVEVLTPGRQDYQIYPSSFAKDLNQNDELKFKVNFGSVTGAIVDVDPVFANAKGTRIEHAQDGTVGDTDVDDKAKYTGNYILVNIANDQFDPITFTITIKDKFGGEVEVTAIIIVVKKPQDALKEDAATTNNIKGYRNIPMQFDKLVAKTLPNGKKLANSATQVASETQRITSTTDLYSDYVEAEKFDENKMLINPTELFTEEYAQYMKVYKIAQNDGCVIDEKARTITITTDASSIELDITFTCKSDIAASKVPEFSSTIKIQINLDARKPVETVAVPAFTPNAGILLNQTKTLYVKDLLKDPHGRKITIVAAKSSDELILDAEVDESGNVTVVPKAKGTVQLTVFYKTDDMSAETPVISTVYNIVLQDYPAVAWYIRVFSNPLFIAIIAGGLAIIIIVVLIVAIKVSKKKKLMRELETMLLAEMDAEEQLRLSGFSPNDNQFMQLGNGMMNQGMNQYGYNQLPMGGGYNPNMNQGGYQQLPMGQNPNVYGQHDMGGMQPNYQDPNMGGYAGYDPNIDVMQQGYQDPNVGGYNPQNMGGAQQGYQDPNAGGYNPQDMGGAQQNYHDPNVGGYNSQNMGGAQQGYQDPNVGGYNPQDMGGAQQNYHDPNAGGYNPQDMGGAQQGYQDPNNTGGGAQQNTNKAGFDDGMGGFDPSQFDGFDGFDPK